MIDNDRKAVYRRTAGILLFLFIFTVNPLQMVAQETKAASIRWYPMEKAQALAQKNGKKVLAYAVTSWCVYCKKMDKNVLPKKAVIDSLNNYFYPVKITLDSNDEMVFNGKKISVGQFARTYNVRATPTTLFIDNEGKIMGQLPGYMSADMYSRLLSFMGSEAYLKMDFKMYMQKYVQNDKN